MELKINYKEYFLLTKSLKHNLLFRREITLKSQISNST